MSEGSKQAGYREPPKEHRFKPGESGNPRGRPKRPKNNAEVLAALNRERIRMTINGKPKWVQPFEAAARRTIQICMTKGNPRDLKILFDLLKEEGFDWRQEMQEDAKRSGDAVVEKLMNLFKKTVPDDDNEIRRKVIAREDMECEIVMSCATCGPALAARHAVHRADPTMQAHPTRLLAQANAWRKRRDKESL